MRCRGPRAPRTTKLVPGMKPSRCGTMASRSAGEPMRSRAGSGWMGMAKYLHMQDKGDEGWVSGGAGSVCHPPHRGVRW